MSISNYAENALLNAVGGTSFSVATPYLQLHTGDGGEDGTANVAGESTRQAVSFSSASGGSMSASSAVTWTNVSTSETLTHWTLWDASTAGNCIWTGAFNTSSTVAAGDTFTITTLTLTLD